MKTEHMFDRSTSVKRLYSVRRRSEALRPSDVIVKILAVGLVFGIASIIAAPVGAQLPDLAQSGADFDFVDHELRYAGGYALILAPQSECEEAFVFLDHELRYAGGYELRPAAVVEKGADFAFLDHELRYAGGYGLTRASVVERGEDFAFLDHELRYAGGYELAGAPLARMTADLSCLSQ